MFWVRVCLLVYWLVFWCFLVVLVFSEFVGFALYLGACFACFLFMFDLIAIGAALGLDSVWVCVVLLFSVSILFVIFIITLA